MAETLPSPPLSRATTPRVTGSTVEIDELTRRLDSLLEEYLESLDEYTSLRAELSRTLSNGYFSLAHAQRTSNLGPGRRYGQDGYDARMKALRRVKIQSSNRQGTFTKDTAKGDRNDHADVPQIEIVPYAPNAATESADNKASDRAQASLKVEAQDKPTENLGDQKVEVVTPADTQKEFRPDPAYRDPVSWYGILVPPNLRQAQKHFITATEVAPGILTSTASLTRLEGEIQAARAALNACLDSVDGEMGTVTRN